MILPMIWNKYTRRKSVIFVIFMLGLMGNAQDIGDTKEGGGKQSDGTRSSTSWRSASSRARSYSSFPDGGVNHESNEDKAGVMKIIILCVLLTVITFFGVLGICWLCQSMRINSRNEEDRESAVTQYLANLEQQRQDYTGIY